MRKSTLLAVGLVTGVALAGLAALTGDGRIAHAAAWARGRVDAEGRTGGAATAAHASVPVRIQAEGRLACRSGGRPSLERRSAEGLRASSWPRARGSGAAIFWWSLRGTRGSRRLPRRVRA